MPVDRSAILEQLSLAAPALADYDTLPALSCFHFNGQALTAYNDRIGISVPAGGVGFQGLVKGKLLLDLLKASSARDVEITDAKTSVDVKVGASKIKLGWQETGSFMFRMP